MSPRAPGLREGAIVDLTANEVSARGDGVALYDGCAVHVPDLFPQERARVRVLALAGRGALARGRVVERLHDDPDRVPAACPRHFARSGGQCSGCPLMTLAPPAQRRLKGRLVVERLGMEVDRFVSRDPPLAYRWSAKRVVGGRAGALRVGSYVRDSHRLADMTGCLVDHPSIDACVQELIAAGDALGIEPYSLTPAGPRGELRYLWLRSDGERVLITLVSAVAEGRARELAEHLELPAGIAHCVQEDAGNRLRGHSITHLRGDATLGLELAGERVELGALGFLQPNPAVAALAYRDLVRDPEGRALPGRLALDLYAGAGVTTRLLRATHDQVFACESDPESARASTAAPETAQDFLTGWVGAGARPDLVIANPPRAGLGEAVCASLLALAPARLHLMSCNPDSLARDLARLAPSYRIERVRAFDTLPHTTHVEVVAWLVRRDVR